MNKIDCSHSSCSHEHSQESFVQERADTEENRRNIALDGAISEMIESVESLGDEVWTGNLKRRLENQVIKSRVARLLADAASVAFRNVVVSGSAPTLDKRKTIKETEASAKTLVERLAKLDEPEAKGAALIMSIMESPEWCAETSSIVVLADWAAGNPNEAAERNRRAFQNFKEKVWRKWGGTS